MIKKIIPVYISVLLFLFTACSKKEMQISRSNIKTHEMVNDNSAAYIIKNNNGLVELNKNNLIGNTNWILTIQRDLTLEEIISSLDELFEKKYYSKSMHSDDKSMFLVYSDTLHKTNSFVPFKFKFTKKITEIELLNKYCFIENNQDLNAKNFEQKLQCIPVFSSDISIENFVNYLILNENLNGNNSLGDTLYYIIK